MNHDLIKYNVLKYNVIKSYILIKCGALSLKCGALSLSKCGALSLSKCGALSLSKCGALSLSKGKLNTPTSSLPKSLHTFNGIPYEEEVVPFPNFGAV
ncbi:MAG: hypothetical protein U9R41_02750, partial [Candidatus Marinimicrobia bacterium]|nr:hypothetical protein [Candidatus Neomarinimicrobiota bacterium]